MQKIIKSRPGETKLGGVRKSLRSNAKINNISHFELYDATYRETGIGTYIIKDGKEILYSQHLLNANAVIGLAKALLEFLPDVYIAADDELLEIMKTKVGRANADAEAVARCLRERTGE